MRKIKQNYNDLLNNFKEIAKQEWHKGVNNYTNSVGLTFEDLLNKNADSMFFPDYEGIEIKCSQRFSNYPLSLFSLAFDGPNMYETNRLLQLYGRNDYEFNDNGQKTLFAELNTLEPQKSNTKYMFKLDLDKNEQKIYIQVYDKEYNIIEKISYITFESLKNHLITKLSNLALVLSSKKEKDNLPYFRYYQITIYKLISFEKFIELIQNDIIKIKLICELQEVAQKWEDNVIKISCFQFIKKTLRNYLLKSNIIIMM